MPRAKQRQNWCPVLPFLKDSACVYQQPKLSKPSRHRAGGTYCVRPPNPPPSLARRCLDPTSKHLPACPCYRDNNGYTRTSPYSSRGEQKPSLQAFVLQKRVGAPPVHAGKCLGRTMKPVCAPFPSRQALPAPVAAKYSRRTHRRKAFDPVVSRIIYMYFKTTLYFPYSCIYS